VSASLTPTVAAPPNTVQTATQLLAMMASLSGVATDYNQGSQIRTLSEANGSVADQQGIATTALALQSLLYGAMSLFGIGQTLAVPATGLVLFATALPLSAAPVVPQAVPIPSGTLAQTAGGIQVATTAAATLTLGASGIFVGAQAVVPGVAGNIPASGITGAPLNQLGYPLVVTNLAPFAGGANAGSQSNALAQFAAKAASLGLSSPVAIANAVVGVTVSGTGETVAKASLYEPWIAAGSAAGSGTAGFTLFIDNGTGSASSNLLAAAQAWITGNQALNQSGFRPAGVPYTVSGVTPVYATVQVSGTLYPGLLATGSVYGAIVSGVTNYFSSLGFSPIVAGQPQIAGQVADAGLGAFSALTVNLCYSGSTTPVPLVSGGVGTRVILAGLSVTLNVGN
jgi:Baseplate J-like protein